MIVTFRQHCHGAVQMSFGIPMRGDCTCSGPLSEFRHSLPASRKNQTCGARSRLTPKKVQLRTHLPRRESAGAGRGARLPVLHALEHASAEYEARRATGDLPKSTISGWHILLGAWSHFVRSLKTPNNLYVALKQLIFASSLKTTAIYKNIFRRYL